MVKVFSWMYIFLRLKVLVTFKTLRYIVINFNGHLVKVIYHQFGGPSQGRGVFSTSGYFEILTKFGSQYALSLVRA